MVREHSDIASKPWEGRMQVKDLIIQLQGKNPEARVLIMNDATSHDLYLEIEPHLWELPTDGSVLIRPKDLEAR